MLEGFATRSVDAAEVSINVTVAGDGPPVLLLHGYPQTHVMWHRVAPLLTDRFTVVCADLRGYGDSDKPRGAGITAATRSARWRPTSWRSCARSALSGSGWWATIGERGWHSASRATTLTSFATALDVTLAELHLEAFLPAYDATAQILREREQGRREHGGDTGSLPPALVVS